MIYYAINPATGLIKIGHTDSLHTRLANLRSEQRSRVEILATADGGYDQESELHSRFAHLRATTIQPARGYREREWFHPGDDLTEHIRSLPDQGMPVPFVETDEGRPLLDALDRAGCIRRIARIKEITDTVTTRTGRRMHRTTLNAMLNSVRVSPAKLAWLADGLGVSVEDLTRKPKP